MDHHEGTDGEQSADQRVRAWLRKQRDDLMNMSRRNKLLHFKHTKTASLEIVRPTPDEVLRRLNSLEMVKESSGPLFRPACVVAHLGFEPGIRRS